jgi:polyisoprenoid-binding protein YceI
MTIPIRPALLSLGVAVALSLLTGSAAAQRGAGAGAAPAATAPGTGVRLELSDGSRVRFRVREQLAGISFPNDAVGVTDAVKGTLVLRADGTVDSTQSKLTLDLRTFKTDQDMRDGFIQRRTLETEKFPFAEFVPRRAQGLPYPFPSTPPAQAGFELVGDMTMHGVTSELTWRVVATFAEGKAAGLATTSFPFSTFGLTKPSLARVISVDDTINLEVEFRAIASPL